MATAPGMPASSAPPAAAAETRTSAARTRLPPPARWCRTGAASSGLSRSTAASRAGVTRSAARPSVGGGACRRCGQMRGWRSTAVLLGARGRWPLRSRPDSARATDAAACPLRTAPSMVAGQPVSHHAPARTRPGIPVRAGGRRAAVPGMARKVAECSRRNGAVDQAGVPGRGKEVVEGLAERAHQVLGPLADVGVGGRQARWPGTAPRSGPIEAVRSKRNWIGRAHAGGHGEIGHPAIEYQVHVDDG